MKIAASPKRSGPNTKIGMTRSSLNRVSHGLRGQGLLVPGETAEKYQEHLQGWLDSLHAATYAEAKIISELADQSWKISRLRRIEYAAICRDVETNMKNSPRYRSLTGMTTALTATEGLISALRFGLGRDNLPLGAARLAPLLNGTKGVLAILDGIDAVMAQREVLAEQVFALELATSAEQAGHHHLVAMAETASSVRTRLDAVIAETRTEIEEMKKKMLSELALPNDTDSKKLARYRAQIENSMSRTLDILGKTKSLSKKSGKKAAVKKGSFGSGRSGPEVRLRVIR